MNFKKAISVLLGMAVVCISANSLGQQAELPYYSEQRIRPNVMLLIDTSGSMSSDGENVPGEDRSRMQIVRDVLTGTAPIPVEHDGKQVYMPHDGPGEHWVGSNVGVNVFTVSQVSSDVYTCEGGGEYFVFFDPYDADRQQQQVMDALTSINNYVLEAEDRLGTDLPCIRRVDTGNDNNVDNDYYQGSDDHREVWEATDDCSSGMTFGEAVRRYWDYEDTGQVADTGGGGNPDYVVPVYYTGWNGMGWTDPTTGDHWDYCHYKVGRWGGYYGDEHCLRPTNNLDPDNRGGYFVDYDAVAPASGTAEDLENYKMSWDDYVDAVGIFDAYCESSYSGEMWGDMSYSNWNYWPGGYPDEDGNMTTNRTAYYLEFGCDPSDSNAHVVSYDVPSDSEIRSDIIAEIPFGEAVDEVLPDGTMGQDGDTGPEFVKDDSAGTRLDEYLREKLGKDPAPDMSQIDIDEPDFGGYFEDLYYDDVRLSDPGIMDLYTDVNYGLMRFDSSTYCGSDDFPPDSTCQCVGADLLYNLSSWAEFDAYSYTTPEDVNDDIEAYIQDTGNLHPNGWTPIAASLHDAYRYFYNDGMVNECWGGDEYDPSPSMKSFDLGWPTATGSEDDHIVQEDPYYTDECRYNHLIFLSDGEQSQGEPFNSTGTYWSDWELQQIIDTQTYWVEKMATEGGDPVKSVKSFFIGFNQNASDDMIAQLSAMAAASQMGPDDENTDFLPATNSEELRSSLSKIMNAILGGDFAVSSPEISSKDEIILTTYFTVDKTSPLWKGHLFGWQVPADGDTSELEAPEDVYWQSMDASYEGNAAKLLNEKSASYREIFTYLPDGTGGLQRVDFTTGNLDLLDDYIDPHDYYGSTIEEKIINLVRGTDDAALADGTSIDWKLGGIYHAKPVISKPMNTSKQMNRPGYSQFITDHEDRDKLIFTGTMYGLLHAFSMEDNTDDGYIGGEEVFAFIPNGLLKYLYLLYEGTQIYGADGMPVITDLLFKNDANDDSDDEWKTTLIAGVGGGGTVVYALDLTDVDASSGGGNAVNMWNFRHPKLGFTWSTPVSAPIWVEDGSTAERRPATFFAGGKSDNVNVGGEFFVLDTETGNTLKTFIMPDTDQVDPNSIGYGNTGVTYSGTENYNEGPSAAALYDANKDGGYNWVYVGDYQGRIWKKNITDPDPDNWKQCLFYDSADALGDGSSLNTHWRKPIWNTPSVVRGPDNSVLVYWATGHMQGNESTDNVPNHIFAVQDMDPKNSTDCSYGRLLTGQMGGSTVGFPFEFEPQEKPTTHIYVFDKNLVVKTYTPDNSYPCSQGTVRLYKMHYLTAEGLWPGGDQYNVPGPGEEPYSLSGLSMDSTGVLWESMKGGKSQKVTDPIESFADPMSWGEGIKF